MTAQHAEIRTPDQVELERLARIIDLQKAAQAKSGSPDYDVRHDRLGRLLRLITENEKALCEAMNKDFSGRPEVVSMGADIMPTVVEIKQARKHLKKWMKPEKRSANFPLGLIGAKAELHREPKGVIGNMATWNFPVNMALCPVAGIFAAGNRCMLRIPELSPALGDLLQKVVGDYFAEDELAVITGGPEVSAAFAGAGFDHLVYTGSTVVGKKVMEAASHHLTPVTLELGGKCPVLISASADVSTVAARVAYSKTTNAGQICLAPDYLLAPATMVDNLVEELTQQINTQLPDTANNPDYTSIISDHHYARLLSLIDDAKAKGATVIRLGEMSVEDSSDSRKMPLHIVLNATHEMRVMQEEIFGPVLPILPYESFGQAIDSLRGRDKPLASYYFGSDDGELADVIKHVPSGATTVNDLLYHAVQHELPFGGVGSSGMGVYHGKDGFNEFSNARAVFKQGWFDVGKYLHPPYSEKHISFIRKLM